MPIVKLLDQHSGEATQKAFVTIKNCLPTSGSDYNNKFNYLSFQ